MALTSEQIASIDALLADRAPDMAVAGEFRQKFPGISVTRCEASDMDAEVPFRKYSRLSLFLVDRSDHCWRITADPARATGVVVAAHKAGA